MTFTHALSTGLLACLVALPVQAQDYRYRGSEGQFRYMPRWNTRSNYRYQPTFPAPARSYYPSRYPSIPTYPTYPAADHRRLWVYTQNGGGSWQDQGNRLWIQTAWDGPFYFQETARTPAYVELYDQQRNIYARLFHDHYEDFSPGRDQYWNMRLPGGWR